jgi:hypothetical protein
MKSEILIPEDKKQYDYRSNLIVDSDNPILIQKAWRDHFSGESYWKEGKDGGKAYLGVRHGEDAMTWNVFRSLQQEGPQGLKVIADIFGLSQVEKILFWGCDVETAGEEQQLLSILIRRTDGQLKGTMTEPDLVLIAEKEVAFIECKLNQSGKQSPWKAQQGTLGRESGAAKRMKVYEERFPEIGEIKDWQGIYQIIRQYVYARLLGDAQGKKPVVIPLINEDHLALLKPIYVRAKSSPLGQTGILRDMVTWQALLSAISRADLKCGMKLQNQMSEAFKASKRFGKKAQEYE